MTALSRVLASIWSRGHALDLIDTILPGEYGCVTCGWHGPKADAKASRYAKVGQCPECGRGLYEYGYLDGDDIAAITKAA